MKRRRRTIKSDVKSLIRAEIDLLWEHDGTDTRLKVYGFRSSKNPSDDVILAIEEWARVEGMRIRLDKSLAPHVEMVIRNGGADLVKSVAKDAVNAFFDRFGKKRLP